MGNPFTFYTIRERTDHNYIRALRFIYSWVPNFKNLRLPNCRQVVERMYICFTHIQRVFNPFLFSKFNAFIKGVRNYSLSSMRWSTTVGGFMRDLIKFKLTLSLWRGTTYASPMKCIGLYAAKLQTRTLENVNI